MRKVKILVKQHSYLYKNDEYDFYKLSDTINLYNSKMKIIILEEPLYIKIFKINKNIRKISEFIQDKIDNIFPQNGDILYDYEKLNSEGVISIYSIKGKRKIEKLITNAKDIQVVPIQFFMREVMMKKMKNKKLTCGVIFQIDKNYYYVYIKKGLIADNYISGNLDEIIDKINAQQIESQVYIDDCISDINIHKSHIKFIKINIKEQMHEKLY